MACPPCGKPIVVPTFTAVPARIAAALADIRGPDADGRDVVLRSEPAAVLDGNVIQLGTQQGVVDRLRDVAPVSPSIEVADTTIMIAG